MGACSLSCHSFGCSCDLICQPAWNSLGNAALASRAAKVSAISSCIGVFAIAVRRMLHEAVLLLHVSQVLLLQVCSTWAAGPLLQPLLSNSCQLCLVYAPNQDTWQQAVRNGLHIVTVKPLLP